MDKDKDFEEKKNSFVEVLKLMEMCNTARSSRDKQGAMSVATKRRGYAASYGSWR